MVTSVLYPEQKRVFDEIKALVARQVDATASGRVKSIIVSKAWEQGLVDLAPVQQKQLLRQRGLVYEQQLTEKGKTYVAELVSQLLPLARNTHFWELNAQVLIPHMEMKHLAELLVSDNEEIRKLAKGRWDVLMLEMRGSGK